MNIFFLDRDPIQAARYHCDMHVIKMIVEYGQLLSTAHRCRHSPVADQVYKPTHVNHPCAVWARKSKGNYRWLYDLFYALSEEYKLRYGKEHKTAVDLMVPLATVPDMPDIGFTEPPQCMPNDLKDLDAVTAYRRFYVHVKSDFARWKYSDQPPWWPWKYVPGTYVKTAG